MTFIMHNVLCIPFFLVVIEATVRTFAFVYHGANKVRRLVYTYHSWRECGLLLSMPKPRIFICLFAALKAGTKCSFAALNVTNEAHCVENVCFGSKQMCN